MREIRCEQVTDAVARLCVDACYNLPEDVMLALQKARTQEASPLGRDILQQLLDNARKWNVTPELISGYLLAFKYGMPPHGGCAIGLERLLMLLTGLTNLREASLFPRDMDRLSP